MTTAQTSGAAAALASRPTNLPAGYTSTPKAAEVPLTMFYSTTGVPVSLALTDGGHTAIVFPIDEEHPDGTPLHPRFHRKAVENGCLPVGAQNFQLPKENQAPTRDKVILDAFAKMVEGNEPTDFTGAGLPNLNNLQRIVGFRVAKDEMEKLWAEFKTAQE